MNMDEAIQVSCIIDKLPPPRKDSKHTLKHNKEELILIDLGNHPRIEESLKAHDSDKTKGNNVAGLQLNILNDVGNSAFMSTFKLNDSILWHARLGHVHFKRMQDISKDGLIQGFYGESLLTGERSIECIFVGYAEHSKAFKFYVIEPNELVSINSMIESRDAIFEENRFSSVPRPSQKALINGTKDIGGTRDEVFDQYSYCFNVEDDPKTFDEAMNVRNKSSNISTAGNRTNSTN
ncbi:zinc finger, CCHC-type containing protein [Tanacetum coccineum]